MAQRQQRFPGVARRLLRDAMLDATVRLAAESGWDAIRMADVAAAVGVSRQTLYAEFGSKRALVKAVVLDRTDRLMSALASVLVACGDDVHAAVRDCCRFLLKAAREDALVKTLLAGPDEGLLVLVTTESAPIIQRTTDALLSYFAEAHPGADQRRIAVAADALARLVVSHVVLPDRPLEEVAEDVADVLSPYLRRVLPSCRDR